MIKIKRAYDSPSPEDGQRFLVDRLWPRGLKKEELQIAGWFKEAGPTNQLRKWFNHDPQKWAEFRRRYFEELQENPTAWEPLLEAARHADITLVYSARDSEHNQAVVLAEFLQQRL